jgi:hypothetical protein
MVGLYYIYCSMRWEYELLTKRNTDNLSYKLRSDVTEEIRVANDVILIEIIMSYGF